MRKILAVVVMCFVLSVPAFAGSVTDDADFFKYNPYPGMELHSWGYRLVTGWKGTFADIKATDRGLIPYTRKKGEISPEEKKHKVDSLFKIPLKIEEEWLEPGRLRFVVGAGRNIFTLNVMQQDLLSQPSPEVYKMPIVKLNDSKGNYVTELKVNQSEFYIAQEGYPDPNASKRLGFDGHGPFIFTKGNIRDIKAAMKKQKSGNFTLTVSVDPYDMENYLEVPNWVQWGFGVFVTDRDTPPTYYEALSANQSLAADLKADYAKLELIMSINHDFSYTTFIEENEAKGEPSYVDNTDWFEIPLYEYLPMQAIMNGEYEFKRSNHKDTASSNLEVNIKRGIVPGQLIRKPGMNKYDKDFPDVIILNTEYWDERIKKMEEAEKFEKTPVKKH